MLSPLFAFFLLRRSFLLFCRHGRRICWRCHLNLHALANIHEIRVQIAKPLHHAQLANKLLDITQ